MSAPFFLFFAYNRYLAHVHNVSAVNLETETRKDMRG